MDGITAINQQKGINIFNNDLYVRDTIEQDPAIISFDKYREIADKVLPKMASIKDYDFRYQIYDLVKMILNKIKSLSSETITNSSPHQSPYSQLILHLTKAYLMVKLYSLCGAGNRPIKDFIQRNWEIMPLIICTSLILNELENSNDPWAKTRFEQMIKKLSKQYNNKAEMKNKSQSWNWE